MFLVSFFICTDCWRKSYSSETLILLGLLLLGVWGGGEDVILFFPPCLASEIKKSKIPTNSVYVNAP